MVEAVKPGAGRPGWAGSRAPPTWAGGWTAPLHAALQAQLSVERAGQLICGRLARWCSESDIGFEFWAMLPAHGEQGVPETLACSRLRPEASTALDVRSNVACTGRERPQRCSKSGAEGGQPAGQQDAPLQGRAF